MPHGQSLQLRKNLIQRRVLDGIDLVQLRSDPLIMRLNKGGNRLSNQLVARNAQPTRQPLNRIKHRIRDFNRRYHLSLAASNLQPATFHLPLPTRFCARCALPPR